MSRQVTHDGQGAFAVRFAFDRSLVDRIKSLPNRRWIATERYWSVPDTDVVLLVDALAGGNFRFDETTRQMYRRMGGNETLPGSPPPPAAANGAPRQVGLFDEAGPVDARHQDRPAAPVEFTVAQLNESVRQALESAFPDSLWLVGEISGFNKSKHRRIVGFHLVELEDDGRKVAEVGATLFDTERQMIERGLRRAGNPFRLEDEVRVRVKVRVELYVPWGSYRVIVEDIDLKYTLGEAARRREEILRRLSEQKLLGLNSTLPMPALPLSVGLITSLGSDAYNDVMRTLEESGYAFRVAAHGARVQGRQTEPSILNALDWFHDRADEFDVLIVCRGGGSRTDLAWFDSEALGRAVATFGIPVVVGVGHEQDHSVLDAVARRAKTPTAAAGMLVEAVRRRELLTEELGQAIVDWASERIAAQRLEALERGRRLTFAARSLLRRESDYLLGQRRRAQQASRGLVAAARRMLSRSTAAIPRASTLLLARRDEQLAAREHRLRLLDPRRVLERGYSILRRTDGRVVTAADQAPAKSALRAELRHGALLLRSEGPAADAGEP